VVLYIYADEELCSDKLLAQILRACSVNLNACWTHFRGSNTTNGEWGRKLMDLANKRELMRMGI